MAIYVTSFFYCSHEKWWKIPYSSVLLRRALLKIAGSTYGIFTYYRTHDIKDGGDEVFDEKEV